MSRRQEAIQLAAEADVDPRTAERWRKGKPVLRAVAQLLEQAAKRLGIERDASNDQGKP